MFVRFDMRTRSRKMAGNAALVRARQALFGKFVADVHKMGESLGLYMPTLCGFYVPI